MKLISFHIPETLLEGLNELVELKFYPNRSEAIRIAIRKMVVKDFYVADKIKRKRE